MRLIKILVVLLIFLAVFLPLVLQYFRAPPGTSYALGDGYMPDYYQYLSWIKSGMEGHFLLNSRYVSAPPPAALVHPLFSVTGAIAGFFPLSPPAAYLVLRIVAILVFFVSLYLFIRRLYPAANQRIIALLFFLTGTGFATIPWSGHFGIISKYSLPPHHLLALAAFLGLLAMFPRGPLVKLVLIGWILALLNPSIFLFALGFLIIGVTLRGKKYISKLFLFLLGITPIVLYNVLTLRSVPPWSIMYERMLHFNPPTTFMNYLLSLGPLLPLSFLGVWAMRKKLTLTYTILISWAYMPIALFPFVGSVLPVNYSRLFQTYQYIPITLLALSGLAYFIRPPLLRKFIGISLVAALTIYGSIAYVSTLKRQIAPHDLSYYNVFVPKSLLAAFRFLDAQPTQQVVLSGEYVSQMVPAFTKHRSLIGRDDSILDYYPLRDRVFAFLDGRMTEEEAEKFVQKQGVNYVIFGIDTKPLSDLPTKNYRFLVPIFTDGTVSVTLVQ